MHYLRNIKRVGGNISSHLLTEVTILIIENLKGGV